MRDCALREDLRKYLGERKLLTQLELDSTKESVLIGLGMRCVHNHRHFAEYVSLIVIVNFKDYQLTYLTGDMSVYYIFLTSFHLI